MSYNTCVRRYCWCLGTFLLFQLVRCRLRCATGGLRLSDTHPATTSSWSAVPHVRFGVSHSLGKAFVAGYKHTELLPPKLVLTTHSAKPNSNVSSLYARASSCSKIDGMWYRSRSLHDACARTPTLTISRSSLTG
mmetsp:Transcript_38436/g.56616  ORF Transcript_38436/g.56616 Transcript_38436/m.56616 type:complete len:135 (-) Transcript_38436:537-941(-)